MRLIPRSRWLALAAASCWLAASATAATDVAEAAKSATAGAQGSTERLHTPKLTDKKLQMMVERIPRRIKMQNPARADQPHEAIAFYSNKRTGPINTRGADITKGTRPLNTQAYLDALAAVRPARGGIGAAGLTLNATAAAGGLLGNWSNLGPTNQGGRTRQLLIDPTNPSIMYAASVGGGVWKSTNGGGSWNQLTDLVLPNIAVSSLAMDPSNPQVLYAGTGEGFFNGDAIRGNGIYKTTDGGATWVALSATVPTPGVAGTFSYVNQIVVSARYPSRLYAATRTGLYRSNDSGATWSTLVDAGGVVRGCQDLVIQQKRSVGYVFASCGTFLDTATNAKIYRGLDSPSSAFTSVFTVANMGRTSLAIAPSNESIVYALAAHKNSDGMLGVYRSTANGNAGSWTTQVASTDANKLNTLQLTNPVYAYAECVGASNAGYYNQGWYDNVIAVDPANPNIVWTGGIDLMRSTDGGKNWGIANYWWFDSGVDPQYAHADNHVIRFHPGYNGVTNKQMYVANDGGVFRTDDARANVGMDVNAVCGAPVAGGVAWTELNNNYATTQFYAGSVWPDGNTYMGGMQDNGTWRGTTASSNWTKLQGGDGGYTAVDTLGDAVAANDVLFAEYTGLSLQRSTNGGATFTDATTGINDNGFAFIAPFEMNTANRQQLWTGGWYVWRTTNQGSNWTRASAVTAGNGSISAVASSPLDGNRVIVAMSDGFVHYTTTGLSNTSTTVWPFTQPRAAFVSAAAFDPNNAAVAYITYATFTGVSVYKTTNNGVSWTALPGTGANLLPKVPATAVVVDPSDSNRVYVGTDIGVYTTNDGGANWYRENSGFGNVSVEHLEINSQGTKRLYAWTHGRGLWRVDLNP